MPFYDNQNLNRWFFVAIIEQYEAAIDKDPVIDIQIYDMIHAVPIWPLIDYCMTMLDDLGYTSTMPIPLKQAIQNSVDWVQLKKDLLEWETDKACPECGNFSQSSECKC
jgi:hypothetical protein